MRILRISDFSWDSLLIIVVPLIFFSRSCSMCNREMAGYDPHTLVDQLLLEMTYGDIVFNVPAEMNIEETHKIQLILSLSEDAEEIKQQISEKEVWFADSVRVTNRMEAILKGPAFDITTITPNIQAISQLQHTEWIWEIHPNQTGEWRLFLTLVAHVNIDGFNTPCKIKTYEKTITVNIGTSQKAKLFIKNNWEWLWAAILVPVVGWSWRRLKKKKEREKKKKKKK